MEQQNKKQTGCCLGTFCIIVIGVIVVGLIFAVLMGVERWYVPGANLCRVWHKHLHRNRHISKA